MNALPLVLFSLGAVAALDDFTYSDTAAARQVWKAPSSLPPAEMAQEDGRRCLKLRAPFASDAGIPRVFIDREVGLDLRSVAEFTLDLAADPPDAGLQFSLYFRSGNGWYTASGRPEQQGWHTIRFPKGSFRTEETPAGWGRIDGIRFAVWRGDAEDAEVKLARLAAIARDVAIITPDTTRRRTRDLPTARNAARLVRAMLEEVGLPSDEVNESTLAAGALGNRPVAVLAFNPGLTAEGVAALARYVERGGKLFVFFSLPAPLADALGFRRGRYVQERHAGHFAEVRFDTVRIAGMPEAFKQRSWNITAVEPPAPNVYHAMAVGMWHDAEGRPTGHAALSLSDRGAYFSHILLAGDRQAKTRMVAAVLGYLHPPLWKTMAEAAVDRVGAVGHCAGLRPWKAHVAAYAGDRFGRAVAAVDRLQAEARKQAAEGRFPEATATARKAQDLCREVYFRAQPSPRTEARAVWNSSGTGIYPGDWERSCKLLAESGINMVLPNMLWGGAAHYPSDVLPRSSTYEKHGDQIAECLAAARRHGIEVHVWKLNWNLSAAPKEFKEAMRRQGRLQRGYDADWENWLCPSHPENHKLELASMLEVARRYDVDGLHFDYIRYPGEQECYCDGCRERFEADSGRPVEVWPGDCYSGSRKDEYRDWRCRQITRLVADVHREAKKLKPDIRLSAAVFGSYPDCRRSVGQDWVAWIKAGYLDFVCPMNYTISDTQFTSLVENQLRLVEGRVPVYPGIGAWRLTTDRTIGQIHHARRLGASGFTLFNFTPNLGDTVLPAMALGAARDPAESPHWR